MSILLAVCERHGVTVEDLKGSSRLPEISRARGEAIKALYESGITMVAIAKMMRKKKSSVQYWIYDGYRASRVGYYRKYHSTHPRKAAQ